MSAVWNWFWKTAPRPVLVLIVLVAGLAGLVGYHGFMDFTNRTEFCISCHEMKDNSFAEYKESIHFHNSAGVRAQCADCHVPKEFLPKVVRKVLAAKDVWHNFLGTIDSPEKFENHRLGMAQTVWDYMRESDSRECRTCHSYDAMHAIKQGPRAQRVMGLAAKTDQSCIDCHKGIAHQLPKFGKIYAQWTTDFQKDLNQNGQAGQTVYVSGLLSLFSEPDRESTVKARLYPMSSLKVMQVKEGWLEVSLSGWAGSGEQKLYQTQQKAFDLAELFSAVDQGGEITLRGWLAPDSPLSTDKKAGEELAQRLWQTDCQICHARFEPEAFSASQWAEKMQAMAKFTYLDESQQIFVRKYLQSRAK